MKACNKCGETKPKTEFSKNSSKRDGLMPCCKVCNSARARKWQTQNREKNRATKRKWVAANQDKVKFTYAKWKADNPGHCADWRAANPEKAKSIAARYRAANPEKKTASSAKWYAANSDKVKATSLAWAKANPEACRIISHNRRARQRANGGVLSKGLVEKLFKLQRGKCACCHVSLKDGNHMDHRIPVARGGPNEDWNMQLLCPPCNLSKNAKDPIAFMQSRGFLC